MMFLQEDFNPSSGCENLCNFLSFKLSCTNLFLLFIIILIIYHIIFNNSI